MGSKGSQTTTNTSAPNPAAAAAYQSILGQASNVAATPYSAYSGELVAPVNAQQNLGISNINANANYAQPYIQSAASMATNAASPITAAQIQQYENPYTQSVVNATQNQFNNTNAQAQSALQGNAISQGALGGNRVGVAQGILAGQQASAEAPVIAGLESQGYSQGVQTAETEQQAQAQGAYSLGNLGVAGENAALTGANAQFGAGTQQQQTQQALDSAQMQQYYQQEFYPEAITGWQAGIDTGVGSNLGGTSTSTAPPPNPWNQLVGLGTAAAGAFIASDRKVKENIKKIGSLDDGQTIYKFNYMGDKVTRIGLMAQNVEKKHPEAVKTINGIKGVDYDEATKDAEHHKTGGIVGYAQGGMPSGVSQYFTGDFSNPYFSMGITHGQGAPPPPQMQPDQSNSLNAGFGDLAKGYKSYLNNPDNSQASGNDWIAAGQGQGPYAPIDPENARRGGVVGYSDGGSPSFDDQWGSLVDTPHAPMTAEGVADNSPFVLPQSVQDQLYGEGIALPNVPLPTPRPQVSDGGSLNPNNWTGYINDTTGQGGTFASPSPVVAGNDAPGLNTGPKSVVPPPNTGVVPTAPQQPSQSIQQTSQPTQQPSQSTQSQPSDDAEAARKSRMGMALMQAGFGMMASKSPFLGVGIGEGAQAGLQSYMRTPMIAAQTAKLDAEAKRASIQVQREQMNLEIGKQMLGQGGMPQGQQGIPSQAGAPSQSEMAAVGTQVQQLSRIQPSGIQNTPQGPVAINSNGQQIANLATLFNQGLRYAQYGAALQNPQMTAVGNQLIHYAETALTTGMTYDTNGNAMATPNVAAIKANQAAMTTAANQAVENQSKFMDVQDKDGNTWSVPTSQVLSGGFSQWAAQNGVTPKASAGPQAGPQPGPQAAQAPGPTPPYPGAALKSSLGAKQQEEVNAAAVKTSTAKYNGINALASQYEGDLKPATTVARGILSNPKMYSGIGAERDLQYNQVRALLGDRDAAALQEGLQKINAISVLAQVNQQKDQLQEAGGTSSRIFGQQVDQIAKASPSLANTVAGGLFLVHFQDRMGALNSNISQMARDYLGSGHNVLDIGFDQQVSNYLKNNPVFTPQEIANPQLLGSPDAPPTIKTPQDAAAWKASMGIKPGDHFYDANGKLRQAT